MPTPPPFKTADVHTAIRQASKGISRYVFRMWHPDSGGSRQLNSLTHITPHITKERGGPASIFDVEGPNLTKNMRQHLEYTPGVPTMFSSWYGSLGWALCYANADQKTHIAVLDTTQLPKHNNIHYAGSPCLESLRIGLWSEEFLIFGTVSGPGYQARPFERFLCEIKKPTSTVPAVSRVPLPSAHMEAFQEITVAEAVRIGKLFDEKFAIVIAAYLLSIRRNVSRNDSIVDGLLQEFVVRSDVVDECGDLWKENEVIRSSASWTERRNANALLRALIDRQNGGSRSGSGSN